jgi:hypothetical protein
MIVAIDCDLRTSYCVSDDHRQGVGVSPFDAMDDMARGAALPTPDIILFEIASPVSFNRAAGSHAAMYQLAKWALWNVSQAMRLHMFLKSITTTKFLVAPSNEWTRGYDLKTRHAMARCQSKKKDLRECEAMMFFFAHYPQAWRPMPDYLAGLCPADPNRPGASTCSRSRM